MLRFVSERLIFTSPGLILFIFTRCLSISEFACVLDSLPRSLPLPHLPSFLAFVLRLQSTYTKASFTHTVIIYPSLSIPILQILSLHCASLSLHPSYFSTCIQFWSLYCCLAHYHHSYCCSSLFIEPSNIVFRLSSCRRRSLLSFPLFGT